MFEKIKHLFEDLTRTEKQDRDFGHDELHIASAALLVHATIIDGTIEKAETDKLQALLQDRYDLSPKEALELVRLGEQRDQEAVDLYGFTTVLTKNLDQEGRQKIVEMLWEVVLADGVIHEFENNLVWRTAELLGVSTRDRVRLRKEVEFRAAGK